MDTKKANEIIKQKKKRSHISTVIVVIIAFVFAIFIQSPIKYFLVAALIIAGLITFTKIRDTARILYEDCNPQLYYAVEQGLNKQVPELRQIHVAEFIGDYSSAIQLSQNMLQKTKIQILRMGYIAEITHSAFMAGDYELCKNSISDYKSTASGRKDGVVVKRDEFYSAYIDGNYSLSKQLLGEMSALVKQKTNSFDCMMLYYGALTDYALNDFEAASTQFKELAERFPNMHLATVAKAYLNGIENNEAVAVLPPKAADLPPSAEMTTIQKKDIFKMIFLLAGIFACVFIAPKLLGISNSADTPLQAIQKYEDVQATEINYTLQIDEKYSVCIFSSDDSLGVAYLKTIGSKYLCKIAASDSELLTDNEFDYIPSKMHSAGKSSEIVYLWVYNENEVPQGYDFVPIQAKGKNLIFCYKLREPRQYYFNSYGIDFEEW